MRHHDKVAVETCAVIGIQKCGAIPSFWNTEFQNVRGERSGVALIFPQIIGAEICEYESRGKDGYDYKRPVLPETAERV